jgi:hypothetical protein
VSRHGDEEEWTRDIDRRYIGSPSRQRNGADAPIVDTCDSQSMI